MRKRLLPLFFAGLCLSAGSCAGAGAGADYSCPLPEGRSCRSVSEIYDDAKTGRNTVSFPDEMRKNVDAEKRRNKTSLFFHPSRPRAGRPEKKEDERRDAARWPVYSAPEILRMWIAPWQDADGVFHSEKYVYLTVGKGAWTINGKSVPVALPENSTREEIKLEGMNRETPWR